MRIVPVVVGYLETNCYLVACEETSAALLIDPGAEAEKILAAVKEEKIEVKKILLTHGHHDHTGAMNDVRSRWNIPVLLSAAEADFINIPASETKRYTSEGPGVFQVVEDGDEVVQGSVSLRVLFTPGHTPGGVCYLSGDVCFTGDTLFCDGVGRTDFEGGDAGKLLSSIQSKLLTLPDDTTIYPGHGLHSTIGRERRYF